MFVFQQALKEAAVQISEYKAGTLFDCTGLGAALKLALGEQRARELFGNSKDFAEVTKMIARESDFSALADKLIKSFRIRTVFGSIAKVTNSDNVPAGKVVDYDKAVVAEFREWLESEVVGQFEKNKAEKPKTESNLDVVPKKGKTLAPGYHKTSWGYIVVFKPSELGAVEGNGSLKSYLGAKADEGKVVGAFTGPYYYFDKEGEKAPTGYFKVGDNLIGGLFTHEFIGNKDIPAGQRGRAERFEARVSHIFYTAELPNGQIVAGMLKSEAFEAKFGRENENVKIAAECWPALVKNGKAQPIEVRDSRACGRNVMLKLNDGNIAVAVFRKSVTFAAARKSLLELGVVDMALNMDGGASAGGMLRPQEAGVGKNGEEATGVNSKRRLPFALAQVKK